MYGVLCRGFVVTVSRVAKLQIIPILHQHDEEMEEPIVREFIDIDDFRYYVKDGEVSR